MPPTTPAGLVPALELERIADGDPLATRDALYKLWDALNRVAARASSDSGLEAAWPVGCIFTAAVSTDPAVLLGFGTWTAYGTGRVLVAIDAGQSEFDTLDETGGSKTHTLTAAELPAHVHRVGSRNITVQVGVGVAVGEVDDYPGTDANKNSESIGSGTAHNNLPPYIVVYRWRRTA